jgi:hypothetical protein
MCGEVWPGHSSPDTDVHGALTDAGEATAMWALDDLSETFRGQRRSLERQWEDGESTTEDMRIALRCYRTFFDRLLSL